MDGETDKLCKPDEWNNEMILYHRTTKEAAANILTNGFIDHVGRYLTDSLHTGVWVSAEPLSAQDVRGDVLLILLVKDTLDLSLYEWIEEGNYREFLIPAAVLNPAILEMKSIEDGGYSDPDDLRRYVPRKVSSKKSDEK